MIILRKCMKPSAVRSPGRFIQTYQGPLNNSNLVGGLGLAVNTFYYMSYPSTALNVVWALIAVYAIWQLLGVRRQAAP